MTNYTTGKPDDGEGGGARAWFDPSRLSRDTIVGRRRVGARGLPRRPLASSQ